MSVVVERPSAAEEIDTTLDASAELILGRMRVPCKELGVSVISLVVDGTNDAISAMTGCLGRIPGVSVKTALARQCRSGDIGQD